jgi:hypothetical protein
MKSRSPVDNLMGARVRGGAMTGASEILSNCELRSSSQAGMDMERLLGNLPNNLQGDWSRDGGQDD